MNLFGVRNKSKPGFVSEGFTAGNYFLAVRENRSKAILYFIFWAVTWKAKDFMLYKKNSKLLCSESKYKESHISKHIDSKVRYIALCYTTGESKTCFWYKLCLTFTGSVTEWNVWQRLENYFHFSLTFKKYSLFEIWTCFPCRIRV